MQTEEPAYWIEDASQPGGPSTEGPVDFLGSDNMQISCLPKPAKHLSRPKTRQLQQGHSIHDVLIWDMANNGREDMGGVQLF